MGFSLIGLFFIKFVYVCDTTSLFDFYYIGIWFLKFTLVPSSGVGLNRTGEHVCGHGSSSM